MPQERNFPLQWPEGSSRTDARQRKPTPFKVSFAAARDDLVAELDRLGAKEIIISSNVPVKPNGLPYADYAEPSDPAVAVYFTRRQQRFGIGCDGYKTYLGNVRGLGLSIKAIRDLERYGSTTLLERALNSFRALPAPGQSSVPHWSSVLGLSRTATADEVKAAFRRLAHEHHPDKGGDRSRWDLLEQARREAETELEQRR